MRKPFLILTTLIIGIVCSSCASLRSGRSDSRREARGEKDAAYYFIISELETRRNESPRALENLNKALNREGDPYLYYKRASLMASLGDIRKAEQDVKRALEKNPSDPLALILQGKIHQSQGRWKEAVECYEKALAVDSSLEEAQGLLAEAYVATKNYASALRAAQIWAREEPENVTPLFLVASLQYNFLKNQKAAVRAYQQILDVDPGNVKAISSLIEIYLNQKQNQKALTLFEEMEELSPNDVTIKLKMALIYYEQKKYAEAVEKFQELQGLYPEDPKITYYLGVIYENLNRDAEAKAEFQKIPVASQYYKDAKVHEAFLLRRGKKEDEAILVLEEAIRKKSQVSPFYEYLAEIYRDRRDFEKSTETLKRGISKSPDKESLNFSLGVVYDKMGHFEEAIKTMKKVLSLNPDHANALNYVGYSYADRGIKLEEALSLIQKALSLKPGDGYVTDSLGWAYFQSGDLDQAIRYLEEAYRIIPQEPEVSEHLAYVYWKKNDQALALRFFRNSLKLLEKADDKDEDKIRKIKKSIEELHR